MKACGGITAPMLPVKQEVRVVRVKRLACPYFTEQQSSINQNQTVAGFDKAFDAVETQFEQNFLGNSINWEEQEHPMLAASPKTALPSTQKTNTSTSPSLKK